MQNRLIFIARLVAAANGDETKENFEWSVNGRKASKDRVTIKACSNATGMVKMPLQVIDRVTIAVVDHAYQLFTQFTYPNEFLVAVGHRGSDNRGSTVLTCKTKLFTTKDVYSPS